MFEIASQIILCLLLAALIGLIIGYFIGRSSCPAQDDCETILPSPLTQSENDKEVTATSTVVAPISTETPVEVKPLLLSAARNGKKDNLTRIKGIGLKIESTLNSIGIYHFDQIADWTEEHISWVDDNVAFPGRVKRESWVPQAKALATGEETEFSKRVDAGEVSSSKKS